MDYTTSFTLEIPAMIHFTVSTGIYIYMYIFIYYIFVICTYYYIYTHTHYNEFIF